MHGGSIEGGPLSRVLAGLLVASAVAGCAPRMVSTEVPLRRVVLYRNGVAYFERAGELQGSRLRFRVRREHVGDFLATLAVIDARGQARAVSFRSLEPDEAADGLVDVELELAGGEDRHDLRVAYVVEAPIWRPSYRVVMTEGEEALLQAWAVVQNRSGEDWSDVSVSMTSGAPFSFRSDLGRTVIPSRPEVTDSGEVVTAPIGSETALAGGGEGDWDADGIVDVDDTITEDEIMNGFEDVDGVPDLADADEPADVGFEALARSVQPLAVGTPLPGASRYDLTEGVTLPEGGSTMVVIASQTVPAEEALLFRPDRDAPGSEVHPMRVVRIRNSTGAVLERGPVAVYQADALLGQGLLEPLPDGGTTSIPFAIERAVAVRVDEEREEAPGRLVKIANGRITVEELGQRATTFRIRNGAARPVTLYVRHRLTPGFVVVDPPEGAEEVDGALLVPVPLEPGRDGELRILERTPTRRTVDLMNDLGAEAVALYLEGSAVDAALAPPLREALQHRARLGEILERRRELERERVELQRATTEARANLEAVGDIASARALRDRLTRRLGELSSRIDELTDQIVELDAEQTDVRARLAEAISRSSCDLESDRDSG